MNPTTYLGALLLALAAPLAPPARGEVCAFQGPPHVVLSEESRLLQYWIEEDRAALSASTLPESPSLIEFRSRISRALATDPRVLLANQARHTRGADSANVQLVLGGKAGTIRDINCLEALLLSVQTDRGVRRRRPMDSHPTEFLGYVLRREGTLKVYFYTVDQPGIRGLGDLHELLARDLAEGWTPVKNLHNHNFFPGSERVLGGVVPSGADVQYLRSAAASFGLNAAAITNGFHSIDISRADVETFRGP